MPLFILDTDHVSLFQRNHPQVARRVLATPAQSLAVTMVTVEEQMRGWLKSIRRISSSPAVTVAYARLHAAVEYFQTVRLLDFDTAAYERFRTLREQKVRIGTQDLRIAAITLTVGGVLVTSNAIDFKQVPGLELEDWAVG